MLYIPRISTSATHVYTMSQSNWIVKHYMNTSRPYYHLVNSQPQRCLGFFHHIFQTNYQKGYIGPLQMICVFGLSRSLVYQKVFLYETVCTVFSTSQTDQVVTNMHFMPIFFSNQLIQEQIEHNKRYISMYLESHIDSSMIMPSKRQLFSALSLNSSNTLSGTC